MLLVNSNSEVRNCFRIVFIFSLKQSVDIVIAMNASMLTEPMQDLETNEDMILALAGQFKQLSHEPEKFSCNISFIFGNMLVVILVVEHFVTLQ